MRRSNCGVILPSRAASERSCALQVLLLALATLAILFARRPDQFLHPYVWVEDGTYILKAYAERGFASIIEPVQGYHILISKIIALTAFKASILWTPEIQLWLTVAFTAAVVIAIGLSPTHLPWPFACALAALLVPTNPEIFAVSEMSFWWAGLLLILALLWDPDRGAAWLRWLYIVLGGLSAPIIVPICALLGLRAVFERRASEYTATSLAAAAAAVQLITAYGGVDLRGPKFDLPWFELVARQFFGSFLIGGIPYPDKFVLAVTIVFAILFGAAIWFNRARLDRYFVLLALAYLSTCAITVLRHPMVDMHPLVAGPRYYFYPFVLLSWMLLWIAARSGAVTRYGLLAICCWAVLWTGQFLQRRHEQLDWRMHIAACQQSQSYTIPVHSTGELATLWPVPLTGEQCRKLLRDSLF